MIYTIRKSEDVEKIKTKINEIETDKNLDITLVDISAEDLQFNFTFELKEENSKLNFNLFSLNRSNFKKKFFISVLHDVEKTFSYVRYHGIGMNNSATQLTFLSKNNIRPLANIYSEQIIKEILLDDARFGGIPEIDAANNSFTSAHKLTVGSVNEEELFYLTSLGINKIKSVSILIETLYKSFLKEENENLEKEIQKEIENGRTKKL